MEWEDVEALRQAIPPRYPRGDPRNRLRQSPGAKFAAAKRAYEREKGKKWRHR